MHFLTLAFKLLNILETTTESPHIFNFTMKKENKKKLLLRLNNTAAQHQKDSAGNSKPHFCQTARVALDVSDL